MTWTEDDVECVAKALQDYNAMQQMAQCLAAGHAVPKGYAQFTMWDDLDEHEREYVRGVARAALVAMPDGRDAGGSPRDNGGWQPIETAPTDRSFWGWHAEWFEPEMCRAMDGSIMPKSVIERIERTGSSGWYRQPSHWRPRTDVPSPPSQEGSGE